MRTIIVKVSTGYIGSTREIKIQVDDNLTDREIQKIAFNTMLELINWTWRECEDEKK